MKTLTNISKLVIAALPMVMFSKCYNDDPGLDSGKDFTLSTQSEVNSFSTSDDIRMLRIEGDGVTDLSELDVQGAKHIVITKTGIASIDFPALNNVTQDMTVSENSRLVDIGGLDNFLFMSGNLIVENNPVLTGIGGLLNLKVFSGNLVIRGNRSLGEDKRGQTDDYGLNPVRYLMINNIISGKITITDNHPGAATDPALIGQVGAGEVIDYVVGSDQACMDLVPLSETARDLTISGDVTDAGLAVLATKFTKVQGNVIFSGVSGALSTEGFLDAIVCEGGFVFRDCPHMANLKGMLVYQAIKGDVVVEGCPMADFTGKGGIYNTHTVEGSLVLDGVKLDYQSFEKLKTVGGDFKVTNASPAFDFWNMDVCRIEHIGGDLVYSGHSLVNGLGGLQALDHIGGTVTISRNGYNEPKSSNIPDTTFREPWGSVRYGWCLVKWWVEQGITSQDKLTIEDNQGNPVDISGLSGCDPVEWM